MARFAGKVGIVTGAASGIGAAIARQLVAEGAQVIAADRNPPAQAMPGVVHHICDVTVPTQVDALIAEAVARFGGLDLLVNNAGTGTAGSITEARNEDWERVFAVNVFAILNACRPAIPEMRRRGGGAIVNTSSMSGVLGDYRMAAYNASKAAVINFTRSMALDHAQENIRVNALCPGFIARTGLTEMMEGTPGRPNWDAAIPMGRPGTADEMAQVACFLLSDQASYVTGHAMVADGGLTAHTGTPTKPA